VVDMRWGIPPRGRRKQILQGPQRERLWVPLPHRPCTPSHRLAISVVPVGQGVMKVWPGKEQKRPVVQGHEIC
jgi:hypothetical protein